MIHRQEAVIGGRVMSIETGRVAEQASGAVLVRYGDTVILATAVGSDEPREGIDFFPLTVDVEERMYAAGKIPGGFIKREGRATEHAILSCRLADRPLRPLFPKGYRNDVQIVITVVSADQENDPDIMGIVGASAALCLSDIPFAGPVGAVRVGYINDQLVINPLESQLSQSRLDLTIAGTADAVMMVEAGAKELPEELMLEAVRFGQETLQDIIKMQEKLMQAVNRAKRPFEPPPADNDLRQKVADFVYPRFEAAVNNPNKTTRSAALSTVQNELITTLGAQFPDRLRDIIAFYEKELKAYVRNNILDHGVRPDGRDLKTIRPISCEVGLLPRTHGSALFTRGQTQVLSVVTLGSPSDEQVLDGLGASESKRFMLHYNFPPFSTGESKPLRGPGRREIGHGALAQRALVNLLPPEADFPYAMRLVSDILESNGSSSMATVCGGSLALMDAGVPMKAACAGIAMGLVVGDDKKYSILTDIAGAEDHYGDMDFKVAGTRAGITALQMDIKVLGISIGMMREALAQAKKARLQILDTMEKTLSESRTAISAYAPRLFKLKIPQDKIRDLIGPGGKKIKSIIEATGVKIDVLEDGTVHIFSTSGAGGDAALQMVRDVTASAEIGKTYLGKVVRLAEFGAFVELFPGTDGLLHISEISEHRIRDVRDELKLGDQVLVKVLSIEGNKVRLSRKALIREAREKQQKAAAGGAGSLGSSGGEGAGGDSGSHE